MNIVHSFNNLQPKHKRNLLVAAAIVLVVGVSWLLTSVTERKAAKHPRADKPEVTVVSPARTTGVEQFAAQMNVLLKSQEDLQSKYERLQSEARHNTSKEKGRDENSTGSDGEKQPEIPPLTPQASVFEAPTSLPPALPPPPMASPAPVPPIAAASAPSPSGVADQSSQAGAASKAIKIFGESGELGPAQAEEKLNKPVARTRASRAPETAFIPSGAMFTGVLLNGLDAPTSAVAQKNPTPVVMRVKREALLPNYASIDVRECFLMAAGYGQLASERALLRAENLSCVRHDGQVIESKLEAYIVGPDGKVGIPGRLVSKQGQMIAQSLLAGALGGIGQSMTRSRVPSLNINPAESQNIYQSESLSSIGQSGIAGGLATSTNMIAKFYLDMAKETFPIVEVPAGEVATVIVTRGTTLPLKGSTSLNKYIDPNEKSRGSQRLLSQQAGKETLDEPSEHRDAQEAAPSTALNMSQKAAAVAATAGKTKPSFENGIGW